MCIKSPKTPAPPPVVPAPTRAQVAVNEERQGAKRRTEQQGLFANIKTSAFGDTGYGKNTEMVKFGQVGSIA